MTLRLPVIAVLVSAFAAVGCGGPDSEPGQTGDPSIANGDTIVQGDTAMAGDSGGDSTTAGDVGPCIAPGCCTATVDCAQVPSAPCMTVACLGFACVEVVDPADNGASCDDGQFCTVNGICANGVCSGAARNCSEADLLPCAIGVCNEDSQACVTSVVTPAPSCDDGDSCTEGDLCNGMTCAGVDKDCSMVEDSCNGSSCVGGNCTPVPLTAENCDDGEPCTVGDICSEEGLCEGDWDELNCGCVTDAFCATLTDPCNIGRCNLPNNSCYRQPQEAQICDDQNPCTKDDVCNSNGACNGQGYSCTAPVSCIASACDGYGGCSDSVVDGFCYADGTCLSDGQPNPNNSCELCNGGEPQPSWTPQQDNVACDADANGCTQDDSCQDGICKPGAYVVCQGDGLSCTNEICNSTGSSTWQCNLTPSGSGCWISDGCWPASAVNPNEACEVCDPVSSLIMWTWTC